MDAFGVASGLVAIHTFRPDNSFLRFLCRDNPDNPTKALKKLQDAVLRTDGCALRGTPDPKSGNGSEGDWITGYNNSILVIKTRCHLSRALI